MKLLDSYFSYVKIMENMEQENARKQFGTFLNPLLFVKIIVYL